MPGLARTHSTEEHVIRILVQRDMKSFQNDAKRSVKFTNNLGLMIQSRFSILAHESSSSQVKSSIRK